MKLRLFLSAGTLGCLLFSASAPEALAASPSVVVSAWQISGTKADDEFIRLENKTAEAIDLSGFKLSKKVLSGGTCKESALVSPARFQGTIAAHDFFLITHPAYQDFYHADLVYSSASYYLSENTVILLYDKAGALLDRQVSGTACDAPLPDPPPTPSPDPGPTPGPEALAVRFNELFPNPAGDENVGEFIELWNEATTPADLSGFTIRDASKTGSYTFPPGTTINGQSYFVLTRSTSKLSLNNSDETLSLFDTRNTLLDSVHYTTGKEGVSLNRTSSGWRGGLPTPGRTNDLNALPETREKVPKKGYRDMPVSFDARGRDADGDTLKYTWNFGDGHKSYKGETTHIYEDTGDYTVILTTTDGSDDTIETFTIRITALPKPDVHIIALLPNPSGRDTDHEWLMIENRGKKPLNLKGFGIATGWKKLTNHPIRDDFIIKSKETLKLTRDTSRFTLPNEKGRIELRAPDGKVLQKIKYQLPKTITEDTIYQKEKGRPWTWQEEESEEASDTGRGDFPLPPAETITTPPQEASSEKQVLGAETVMMKPLLKSPLELPRLLNYGTRVTLPENIHLRFAGTPMEDPSSTEIAFPHGDSLPAFFSSLNAALNDWQNRK